MIIERLKSTAIIVLTVLALYLTGRLWFDEISNRNFFYMLSQMFFPGAQQGVDQKVKVSTPYRVVTNFGNTKYSIAYNGLADIKLTGICDDVISDILSHGEYVGAQTLDWNTALGERSVIYEFKFEIPAPLYVMSVPQSNNILTSKLKSFRYIVIVPNSADAESLLVYFIDEQAGQIYEYHLERNALLHNRGLQECIGNAEDVGGVYDSAEAGTDGFLYLSSIQSGLEMFLGNNFIPEISRDGSNYNKISLTNPYMTNNELLLNPIEKKMAFFFDNPALMTTGLTNNTIYTFSDESTIIKYYPNDVFEYSNYRVIDKRNPSTFVGDFNAAVSFIMKDIEVRNDFFLEDYVLDDGRHTFYFGYAINDIPMILSEDCKFETGLAYPIEITVENGWITKYRKLVYNYTVLDGVPSAASLDYIGLIGMLTDETGEASEETLLSDIALCYKIDRKSPLTLHWYIRVNNRSITRSAGV